MRELSPLMFLLVIILLLGLGFLLLQTRTQAIPNSSAMPSKVAESSVPTFSSYPADDIYREPIALPDFSSNRQAAKFATYIREAIRQGVNPVRGRPANGTATTASGRSASNGVNFAGHYVVAEWGCGTSCQNHAIIEAKTGKIVAVNLLSAQGVQYQPNSNLLIVNPRVLTNSKQVSAGESADYYLLNNNELQFLLKLFPNEQEPRTCIQIITKAKNFLSGEVKEFSDPCHVPYGWQVER